MKWVVDLKTKTDTFHTLKFTVKSCLNKHS
jgi:hypothetical protein